ncbi:MAG: TonB-dependent receptor [Ignavibacteriales bacterium]|nr:TonB-dependent receptor [Ignavibacteriales bacterium]
MVRKLQIVLLFGIVFGLTVQAQYTIKGKVTDSESKQPLPSANVMLVGTKMGISSDADGGFTIANVPAGSYQIKATLLGYLTQTKSVIVRDNVQIALALIPSAVQVNEVVVEVNRAKERETPVAFSNVGSKSINKQIHSQDAPLLVKNIPGVFSYSTDGVGNGESKMYVRGFDQNRVQVLINGIPTNDPESNAVYWSNWGAVSSAAASIQVQRGAGSSLYGAGSFGGSFNVVTQEVASKFGAEAHASVGSPELGVYGFSVQSGLMASNFVAGALNYEWKTGRGNREGSYYQGANYYAAIATYPDSKTSAKIVMHGGPQEHGYSYNAPIAYFKKYGYDANPAYFLPVDVLKQMVGSKTLEDSLRLTGDSRLLRDSKYLTLSHNFYHKPQLELHLTHDIDENNSVRGTFFYSVGRGGGSSVTGTSNLTNATFGSDTTYPSAGVSAYNNLGSNGVINSDAAAAKYIASKFLSGAVQRISYSLHRQYGVIASWDTKVLDNLKLTLGGEFRDWLADHPGHFTNLYGKQSVSVMSYGYRKANGKTSSTTTFTRRTYQGDMDFGGSDKVDVNYYNPFMGYTLSDDGGTYNSQYRNYVGNTTQGTLFAQANYTMDKLTFIGSLQYAAYKYHLTENMPSESAIADTVAAPLGTITKEGPDGQGNFYMASYANATAASPNAWYKFRLVDVTRSRGFFQPKLGVNFNVTNELNVFANISHVERLLDLSVFYNSGNPNPDASDEKSNQYEVGVGYKDDNLSARLNGYFMTWENKTATITDVSKAGLAGYDRNGMRYELVGESRNMGVEFESSYKLDELVPIKGFTVNLSASVMDNKWTKVLDQVKTNPDGTRRAFDAAAMNINGVVDVLYFDQLENKVNASTPFTTVVYGLTYEAENWFAGVSGTTMMDFYALDGGTYIPTDGYFDNSAKPKFIVTKYSNTLPNSSVLDLQLGLNLKFDPVKLRVTGQVLNVLDTEFLVSANRSGVLPGISRSYRLNIGVGI